jgi:hypothetical protein
VFLSVARFVGFVRGSVPRLELLEVVLELCEIESLITGASSARNMMSPSATNDGELKRNFSRPPEREIRSLFSSGR